MTDKFTKGPWRYGKPWSLSYGCGLWLVTAKSPDRGFVNVLMQGDCENHLPADEAEANARLIAAAPDLLSALEELVDGMTDVEDSKTRVLARARETIAAARGLSSATSTVSEG